MYVPDHFRPSDADVRELLAHLDAADLITATDDGLLATFLPLIHEAARIACAGGALTARKWATSRARTPVENSRSARPW